MILSQSRKARLMLLEAEFLKKKRGGAVNNEEPTVFHSFMLQKHKIKMTSCFYLGYVLTSPWISPLICPQKYN